MIRVDVEDYCHQCLDFHPDVIPPTRLWSVGEEDTSVGDTVIKCEYRRRCAGIMRYLETRTKSEVSK